MEEKYLYERDLTAKEREQTGMTPLQPLITKAKRELEPGEHPDDARFVRNYFRWILATMLLVSTLMLLGAKTYKAYEEDTDFFTLTCSECMIIKDDKTIDRSRHFVLTPGGTVIWEGHKKPETYTYITTVNGAHKRVTIIYRATLVDIQAADWLTPSMAKSLTLEELQRRTRYYDTISIQSLEWQIEKETYHGYKFEIDSIDIR